MDPARARAAWPARLSISALALLTGCAASPDGPAPADPARSPTTRAAHPPAREGATRLSGRLEYRELPQTRSVAAYLGVEFALTDDAGQEQVLEPSDDVPREELVSHHGRRVEVTGEWYVPPPPPPGSEYPVGPDGEPMARPGRYRVLSLVTLD